MRRLRSHLFYLALICGCKSANINHQNELATLDTLETRTIYRVEGINGVPENAWVELSIGIPEKPAFYFRRPRAAAVPLEFKAPSEYSLYIEARGARNERMVSLVRRVEKIPVRLDARYLIGALFEKGATASICAEAYRDCQLHLAKESVELTIGKKALQSGSILLDSGAEVRCDSGRTKPRIFIRRLNSQFKTMIDSGDEVLGLDDEGVDCESGLDSLFDKIRNAFSDPVVTVSGPRGVRKIILFRDSEEIR